MHFKSIATISLIAALTTFAEVKEEKHLALNFGIALSKSVLGISYTKDAHHFNLGLLGLGYSGRDGFLVQPTVGYNHYFTRNGFYGSLAYAATYRNGTESDFVFSQTDSAYHYTTRDVTGWKTGMMLMGLGKSFQFPRWGIHLDGNLITPASRDFGSEWGWLLGAGISYRFHLGD
jgi:hypothetical protein